MAAVLLAPVRHDRDVEAHRVRFHDDDLVSPGSSSSERGEIVRPLRHADAVEGDRPDRDRFTVPGHPIDRFDELVIERPPGIR
jgi:hypothetical protein